VHHVQNEPAASPHIVNLKNNTSPIWQDIESKTPTTMTESTFHSYHKLPSTDETKQAILPSPSIKTATKNDPVPEKFNSYLTTPPTPVKQKIKTETDKTWLDLFHNLFPLKPTLLSLAIITLILVVPGQARSYFENLQETKDVITENSTAGFLALQQSTVALKNADIDTAAGATALAGDRFNAALSTIEEKHHILQTIITAIPILHGELESREKILLAGQEITIGNSYLLNALQNAKRDTNKTFSNNLIELSAALASALPNYDAAVNNLQAVDVGILPYQYQAQFTDFRNLFTAVVTDFKNVNDLSNTLQEVFGGKGFRRYLLVFQNPSEIRATGGFIGSFAILDVNNGKIDKLDIPAGGSYDLQGQLPDYLIPPLPLTLTNKRWEFQDANWFPDFPASAKKMLWFFHRSRGITADGVISINATVLQRLLSIIGPVVDLKRDLILTAETALPTIQTIVESSTEKLNHKPKQILSDLTPQLLQSLTSTPPTAILPLLISLEDALGQKEIQAYFTDQETESNITSFGWSGALAQAQPNEDYLFVVNTNIQGEKSDAKIKQTISHQAVIANDGSVVDTVIITREHTGTPTEPLYGTPNLDYLRLYVPAGSTLISASGFTWPDEKNFRAPESWYKTDTDLQNIETEVTIDNSSGTRITNEFGKTAFGNWVATAPGTTSQVVFSYRLSFLLPETNQSTISMFDRILAPFGKSFKKYSLLVQKQSGITSDFESQILLPPNWQPKWTSDDQILIADNGVRVTKLPLTNDRLWITIIQPTKK
jgi:hypothetical protein